MTNRREFLVAQPQCTSFGLPRLGLRQAKDFTTQRQTAGRTLRNCGCTHYPGKSFPR